MNPDAQSPRCGRGQRRASRGGRVSVAAWRKFAAFACAALLLGCAAAPVDESPYALGAAAFKMHDYKQAAAQWSIATGDGDPLAMNNLGFLLSSGLGVEKDQPRAFELWKAAAAMGVAESQFYLGYSFENGVVAPQDPGVAYAWYQCAAQSAQGSTRSGQVQLAKADQHTGQRARDALAALTPRLSTPDLERGQALAVLCIENYAAPVQAAEPPAAPAAP